MSRIEDKQAAETQVDTSKGPVPGGIDTKPKLDPNDGSEVEEIVAARQPATGPKPG